MADARRSRIGVTQRRVKERRRVIDPAVIRLRIAVVTPQLPDARQRARRSNAANDVAIRRCGAGRRAWIHVGTVLTRLVDPRCRAGSATRRSAPAGRPSYAPKTKMLIDRESLPPALAISTTARARRRLAARSADPSAARVRRGAPGRVPIRLSTRAVGTHTPERSKLERVACRAAPLFGVPPGTAVSAAGPARCMDDGWPKTTSPPGDRRPARSRRSPSTYRLHVPLTLRLHRAGRRDIGPPAGAGAREDCRRRAVALTVRHRRHGSARRRGRRRLGASGVSPDRCGASSDSSPAAAGTRRRYATSGYLHRRRCAPAAPASSSRTRVRHAIERDAHIVGLGGRPNRRHRQRRGIDRRRAFGPEHWNRHGRPVDVCLARPSQCEHTERGREDSGRHSAKSVDRHRRPSCRCLTRFPTRGAGPAHARPTPRY